MGNDVLQPGETRGASHQLAATVELPHAGREHFDDEPPLGQFHRRTIVRPSPGDGPARPSAIRHSFNEQPALVTPAS